MKLAAALGLALLAGGKAKVEVLENDYVKVSVDPSRGGAVTSMVYKKATTFPFIADKGAGVAGLGAFFPVPVADGATLALKADPLKKEKDEVVLRLSASPKGGPAVERLIRLGKNESGFRITDTVKGAGTARLGSSSRQDPQPWRMNARNWFGDAQTCQWKFTPYNAGDQATLEAKSGTFFWRHVGQYGVGFLYRSDGAATLTHTLPKDNGCAVEFAWQTAELPLPARLESVVLIDEGGREGSHPPALARGERAIVTLDLRAGGAVNEPVPGFATVVSALPFKGKIVVAGREIPVALEPGKAKVHPFDVVPDRKGVFPVEAALVNEKGEKVASASTRAVVEGEGLGGEHGATWATFVRKIPNAVYRGTWADIGAQLAKAGRLKPKGADARASERRAFYERHFPYYAELIKGAAGALGAQPEQFVDAGDDTSASAPPACMDIFFNGPDGPINAFSKERGGGGMGGLAYMKVIPDKGYPYHVYECGSWQNGYGVNSEGLSTSGASINCDGGTTSVGRRGLQDWKAAGKVTAPLGSHMMLATCKNVEEAIAFIENPNAPFEFEGNMLLVDRAGNAARLESVGIHRQIHRYDAKKDRFFVAGNYPHEGQGGLFKIGPDWGWAANTMMRERQIEELVGPKKAVSLRDVFMVMESHGAGGMCQHIFENVGKLFSNNHFIAVCRTGDLWLSQGPPCKARYAKFSLKDGE